MRSVCYKFRGKDDSVVIVTSKSECSREDERRQAHKIADLIMSGLSFDQAMLKIKEESKPSAPQRERERLVPMRLDAEIMRALKPEAKRRAMSARELAEVLVKTIVADKLFSAVLDK